MAMLNKAFDLRISGQCPANSSSPDKKKKTVAVIGQLLKILSKSHLLFGYS
jgi:hypothetical protein